VNLREETNHELQDSHWGLTTRRWKEPYKLDLICTGRNRSDAKLHIRINFRPKNPSTWPNPQLHSSESRNGARLPGICSEHPTRLTLCQARKGLTGLTAAPARPSTFVWWWRELERLHSPLCSGQHSRGQAHGF